MALYTCPKYVDPQEVWEYSHKYVCAREKVCVGGEEGRSRNCFHFKKLEGQAKALRAHHWKSGSRAAGREKLGPFSTIIPSALEEITLSRETRAGVCFPQYYLHCFEVSWSWCFLKCENPFILSWKPCLKSRHHSGFHYLSGNYHTDRKVPGVGRTAPTLWMLSHSASLHGKGRRRGRLSSGRPEVCHENMLSKHGSLSDQFQVVPSGTADAYVLTGCAPSEGHRSLPVPSLASPHESLPVFMERGNQKHWRYFSDVLQMLYKAEECNFFFPQNTYVKLDCSTISWTRMCWTLGCIVLSDIEAQQTNCIRMVLCIQLGKLQYHLGGFWL